MYERKSASVFASGYFRTCWNSSIAIIIGRFLLLRNSNVPSSEAFASGCARSNDHFTDPSGCGEMVGRRLPKKRPSVDTTFSLFVSRDETTRSANIRRSARTRITFRMRPVLPYRRGAISVTLRPFSIAETRSAVSRSRSQNVSGPSYPAVKKGLLLFMPILYHKHGVGAMLNYENFVTKIS